MVSHGSPMLVVPISRPQIGTYSASMSRSFTPTMRSVLAVEPFMSADQTKTMAVQGAPASSTRPAT